MQVDFLKRIRNFRKTAKATFPSSKLMTAHVLEEFCNTQTRDETMLRQELAMKR